jgi:hypothetical protein
MNINIHDQILNFPVAHVRYVHTQCLHFMLMPFYRIFHCIHSMLQALPCSDGSCKCVHTQLSFTDIHYHIHMPMGPIFNQYNPLPTPI